jgi:hypothetical protein
MRVLTVVEERREKTREMAMTVVVEGSLESEGTPKNSMI